MPSSASASSLTFSDSLSFGRAAESDIATWVRSRGWSVLPVYETLMETGKGPQLFTPLEGLIAPDMLIFKGDKALWIEAKHKTAFSWHRMTRRWCTGIDLRHYADYCKVADSSPWPVWLLFLHRGGQAKDSPPESPAGLFGNTLEFLRDHEHHRHSNYGRSGMVYWELDRLVLLAALETVLMTTA